MGFNLKRTMEKHPFLTGIGGMGLGGGIGAILSLLSKSGGLSGLMSGTPGKEIQTPIYNPEQESILDQLLQQGQENTDFSGIEDMARQRFQEDTIPSIAERFTRMGGQRSSAFQGTLGQAGAGLETQLSALRPQFGMQQLQMGMRPRFNTQFQEGKPGLGQSLASSIPKLLGMLGGML